MKDLKKQVDAYKKANLARLEQEGKMRELEKAMSKSLKSSGEDQLIKAALKIDAGMPPDQLAKFAEGHLPAEEEKPAKAGGK